MDNFETMHTCCGYIEDVHVNFFRGKIIFKTFHRCYKHTEDVHVTFSRQENDF